MARPAWKGNNLNIDSYNLIIKNIDDSAHESNNLGLVQKRNIVVSSSLSPFLEGKTFELYTGYDFIKKVLKKDSTMSVNLATLINTREVKVVHKTKMTKHQRKASATAGAKKKLINVSKKPKVKVKNKKTNK